MRISGSKAVAVAVNATTQPALVISQPMMPPSHSSERSVNPGHLAAGNRTCITSVHIDDTVYCILPLPAARTG